MWYFICVIQSLEVIVSVHRKLIIGPVTITGAYILPLIVHTERLGAVPQPIRGTQDGILFLCWVSILFTLRNISHYLLYIGIIWMRPHLESRQLDLQKGT